MTGTQGSADAIDRSVRQRKAQGRRSNLQRRLHYVQIYDSARTTLIAQLEQFAANSHLIYRTRNYDFDVELARQVGASQLSRLATIFFLIRNRPHVVELNEAAMLPAWPSLILYVTTIKVLNMLSGCKIRVVSYAIENNDTIGAFSSFTRAPHWLSRHITRFVVTYLLSENRRLAFGSPQAHENYRRLIPRLPRWIQTKTVLELPGPCSCGSLTKKPVLLFVGEFSPRKGVAQMMEVWDEMEDRRKAGAVAVEFVLVGKGELVDEVLSWASTRSSVEVVVDPPRDVIHERLREATLLILLSQSSPRWREQTALPIGEGLAHGCRIVSTDQVGFSQWLRENGHIVVQQRFDTAELADRVLALFRRPLDPALVVNSLTKYDSRLEIDGWLRQEVAEVA